MKILIGTCLGEYKEVSITYENGEFNCPYCGYPTSEVCNNPACPSTYSNPKSLQEYYDKLEAQDKEIKRQEYYFKLRNSSYGKK
jgi:hypothetical protein